jgi:uncharacterized protein
VVTVGKQTEERFAAKDEVRNVVLEGFKRGDYDGGLIAGMNMLKRDLTAEFPLHVASYPRDARPVPPYEGASYGTHHFGWWSIIALGFGIYFLVRIFSRRGGYGANYSGGPGATGPGGPAGGGYGGGPMGGGFGGPVSGGYGGGGFGRSMLGGILGAVGGNWLYDRFRGGPSVYGGGLGGADFRRDDAIDVPAGDDGDVGSSSSGSWDGGGSGGGDWGGDSGGGGGDSGGGGDW